MKVDQLNLESQNQAKNIPVAFLRSQSKFEANRSWGSKVNNGHINKQKK